MEELKPTLETLELLERLLEELKAEKLLEAEETELFILLTCEAIELTALLL